MRDTSPVGHTSLSRTAMCATGLSTENSRSSSRLAHDVDVGEQRRRIEGERVRIVAALVAGKFRAEPDDAVFAAVSAGGLLRADGQRRLRAGPSARCPSAFRYHFLVSTCAEAPEAVADPATFDVLGEAVRASTASIT